MKKVILILSFLFLNPCFGKEQFDILVGFPPGGGQYIIGSIIKNGLIDKGFTSTLRLKPGAGGVIALNECVKDANPYLFCLASQSQLVHSNKLSPEILKYDPKNLNYIKLIGTSPMVLLTSIENKLSLDDIIFDITNNPVTFGSGALGNAYVTKQLLEFVKATRATNVEYNGVGPAINDLIGRHISYVIAPYTAVKAHIDNNKIRLVANLSHTNYFLNIPSIKNFQAPDTLFGFVASDKLNQTSVKKQREVMSEILRTTQVKNSLLDQGIFTIKDDSDFFKNKILNEIDKL